MVETVLGVFIYVAFLCDGDLKYSADLVMTVDQYHVNLLREAMKTMSKADSSRDEMNGEQGEG